VADYRTATAGRAAPLGTQVIGAALGERGAATGAGLSRVPLGPRDCWGCWSRGGPRAFAARGPDR
jgi:hypothetical protein